jgi:membrane protein insertase Oxa1/YidC/SpoIIIJ
MDTAFMEIWHSWIILITQSIIFFSSYFGISEAMAIIALTFITRIILMPISLSV